MKAREPTTQRIFFSVYRNKNWHQDQKGRKSEGTQTKKFCLVEKGVAARKPGKQEDGSFHL